jgi:hypothetical protein
MVTAYEVDAPPYENGWDKKGALSLPEAWLLVEKYRPPNLPISTAMFITIFFEETAICNVLQYKDPIGIGPGQLQVSEHDKVIFFACPFMGTDNFLGECWDSSQTCKAPVPGTTRAEWRPFSLLNKVKFPRDKFPHLEYLQPLKQDRILLDNEFSIKMHVRYFKWIMLGYADVRVVEEEKKRNPNSQSPPPRKRNLDGMLNAQTGANPRANHLFTEGEKALQKLMKPDPMINWSWSEAEWKKYILNRRNEFKDALNVARKFHDNQVPTTPRYDKFWEFLLPDEFIKNPTRRLRDMLFE